LECCEEEEEWVEPSREGVGVLDREWLGTRGTAKLLGGEGTTFDVAGVEG